MLHKQLFSISLDFLSSGCDFLSVTFLPLSCAAAAAAANYPVLLFYSQHTSGAAAAAANVKPITSSAPDCFFFFFLENNFHESFHELGFSLVISVME